MYQKPEDLKLIVQEKYGQIATENTSCGCACGCGTETDYSIFSSDYSQLKGYNKDADLQLGCGIPTQFAAIKKGDTVLDLGSGAGNDCFVVQEIVGETGKVIGLDFTEEMIQKANENKEKLGISNIEFLRGDIEDIPLVDNSIDVVISNCVLNLVPNKAKAFKQIYRVLKPGAHFCVSDIVLKGELPEKIKGVAELYAGCVSGAIDIDKYVEIAKQTGFENVTINQKIENSLPDELLADYLSQVEIDNYRKSEVGVFSITVSGYKA